MDGVNEYYRAREGEDGRHSTRDRPVAQPHRRDAYVTRVAVATLASPTRRLIVFLDFSFFFITPHPVFDDVWSGCLTLIRPIDLLSSSSRLRM